VVRIKKRWIFSGLLLLAIFIYSSKHQAKVKPRTGQFVEQEEIVNGVNENSSSCSDGMVLVEGEYCPELLETCIKWADVKQAAAENREPRACAEFQYPTKCLSKKTEHMKFCMDKYEHSSDGVMPDIMMNFYELKSICEKEGKRLCLDKEFEQACGGIDNNPYPYGYKRNNKLCNIDNHYIQPDFNKVENKDPEELKRLDQRMSIGSTKCESEYGVYDLTGNVDEYYVSTTKTPYTDVLQGGHNTGMVRNRCRAKTIVHNEYYRGYNAGGRCCSDSK
jgi:formylglycine-generating enzyme required for sulfatase activity